MSPKLVRYTALLWTQTEISW